MKFSIRDLLLVTVVVALALGWWAHRRAMTSEHLRLQLENEALRDELREERFPKMEAAESSELVIPLKDQTLEWIPPASH